MTENTETYRNVPAGKALISVICSGCKTPVLEVKFCNLVKPYYYQNSPDIPRYSITCLVDTDEHKEFLEGLQKIEKNEKVESIVKFDTKKIKGEVVTTGKVLIKFQSRDMIPVYRKNENGEPIIVTLEDELSKDEKVMVIYDILRYTKKNSAKNEYGLSFKPSCVYLCDRED